MNYIGSKYRLADFIDQSIRKVVGNDLSNMVFCDLFAGTGAVGRSLKTMVHQVISNDLEYYSYVLLQNYIGNHTRIECKELFDDLNNLAPIQGFIFNQYSENGSENRCYFSESNGKKIDAIRQKIEVWNEEKKIDTTVYFHLLASLVESADKVANTASVYGAYLKKIKSTAHKELVLKPAEFENTGSSHLVYNENANLLIEKIKGDILYLDPPYNAREYGANYHLLNTIALYDEFLPKGKTGLRKYGKSNYCKKNLVSISFEDLISKANFKYIFLSYNNEGLMSPETIKNIMSKYGSYRIFTQKYARFKADKSTSRIFATNETIEYLHVIEKNDIH